MGLSDRLIGVRDLVVVLLVDNGGHSIGILFIYSCCWGCDHVICMDFRFPFFFFF